MQHEHLIAATFAGADAAAQAEAAAQGLAHLVPNMLAHNVALMVRDATGKLMIHETAEARDSSQTSTVGAVSGWLLGFANTLVGGPLGMAEGGPLGMAAGQEMAAERDVGFSDAFLQDLGETLRRGEAALLAVAPADEAQAAVALLQQHGATANAQVVTEELRARLGV